MSRSMKSVKEHAPLRVSFGEDGRLECGCDEAGRGCLAGPVVAAAVILPPTFYHPLLFDSKQLSEHQLITVRLCEDRGGSDACKRGIPLDDTRVGDVVVGLEAVAVNKE